MLEIKPERLAHYRKLLADLDVPMERKDDVILTLASFFKSLIDQAFGVDPVQLAGRERLSKSFQSAASRDTISNSLDAERVDLDSEGATSPTQTRRDVRDGKIIRHESSHLLPRI